MHYVLFFGIETKVLQSIMAACTRCGLGGVAEIVVKMKAGTKIFE